LKLPGGIVVVGRFGAPHGICGWSRLYSFTQPITTILSYENWLIETRPEHWQPLALEAVKASANNAQLKIKVLGCTTPEQARAYTNLQIGIKREQLPSLPADEYYRTDLEGLSVVNLEGVLLGTVSEVLSTGANDVLILTGERERLLPYITQVIKLVDLMARKILVDWDADF